MKLGTIKLDKRAYDPSSNQGDWIKHPEITVVVDGKFIVGALDSDNELRWSAGKGSWSVANVHPHAQQFNPMEQFG
jgi:hypothetical protein